MGPMPSTHEPCPTVLPRAVSPSTPGRTAPGRTTVEEPAQQIQRPWRLVLMDDNDHTYEYVIEMLAHVFGYAKEKSFALARIVDTEGRVTVMTGTREDCEAKQSGIHAYGADPRIPHCKGSMSAVVEEADTL